MQRRSFFARALAAIATLPAAAHRLTAQPTTVTVAANLSTGLTVPVRSNVITRLPIPHVAAMGEFDAAIDSGFAHDYRPRPRDIYLSRERYAEMYLEEHINVVGCAACDGTHLKLHATRIVLTNRQQYDDRGGAICPSTGKHLDVRWREDAPTTPDSLAL